MCLPLSLLTGRAFQPGVFAKQLGATAKEQQGIEGFCEDLIKSLGCRYRQDQGKPTVFSYVHRGVLESLRVGFPDASQDCMAEAVQGIISGIAAAIPACQQGQQAFLKSLLENTAPSIGKLLQCIFGEERAMVLEVEFYRKIVPWVIDWIGCLLPVLVQLCQANMGGNAPPSPPPGGCFDGVCSPPGGGGGPGTFGPNAPPHTPVVDRGGTDVQGTVLDGGF